MKKPLGTFSASMGKAIMDVNTKEEIADDIAMFSEMTIREVLESLLEAYPDNVLDMEYGAFMEAYLDGSLEQLMGEGEE